MGDVNGDGKPDLVVANDAQAARLAFCWATAMAPSRRSRPSPLVMIQTAVAVGDVNGDGKPDLVVANEI